MRNGLGVGIVFSRDGLCHDFGFFCSGFVTHAGFGLVLDFVVEQVQSFSAGHLTQHG
jgi:hypothetical protein